MAMTEAGADRLTQNGGWALAGGAVVSIALMTIHPSSPHAGGVGGIVHGGMILAIGALLFGFAAFAFERRPSTSVIAGVIGFAVGAGAHMLAATINGFAVPAMATWPDGAPGHDVFLLAWQLNQALAALGVVATGFAFIAWAIELRRDHPWLAAAGAMAGAVPAGLLLGGIIKLDIHGALLAYGLHGLWALALGITMLRGKLRVRAS